LSYFLIFDLYFYVRPHFTITAAVAALAATLLWLDSVLNGRTLRGWELAAFLLLVMLSALIRPQSCLLMSAVGLPNLLFAAMHYCFTGRAWAGMSRRRWLSQGVFIPPALAAVVVLAGQLYDAYAYRSTPGWADFHEFNDLRAQFTDCLRA